MKSLQIFTFRVGPGAKGKSLENRLISNVTLTNLEISLWLERKVNGKSNETRLTSATILTVVEISSRFKRKVN